MPSTCTAEPAVTFEEVVRATLPYGLVPIIVPEHKTITLGGAVAGCSIESMSFREGGFHDTCLEYELITAKGDVLRCSPEEHPLVFQMLHGSFGTVPGGARAPGADARLRCHTALSPYRHASMLRPSSAATNLPRS